MAKVNLDIAMESTSQEILSKSQDIYMGVNGLINSGSTVTCSASDNALLFPVTSEITAPNGTTVTCCQYKVNKISGSLRVVASLKGNGNNALSALYVYVNGGQVAKLISTYSATYQTYTADITVADGDTIKITLVSENYIGATAYAKLVTICGDLSEPTTPVPGIKAV